MKWLGNLFNNFFNSIDQFLNSLTNIPRMLVIVGFMILVLVIMGIIAYAADKKKDIGEK